MKESVKIRFDEIRFMNRWKDRHWARPSDWVLIGISTRWFAYDMFCWRFSFFGFDVSIWFKKIYPK